MLDNFFIFNTLYGNTEGEELSKKLFYYPELENTETQIKNIGLVEAIVQFTSTFKPSAPVFSLHTQKKRYIYYQPEENFWMVMTLNVPQTIVTKDGTTSTEYVSEEIQDNVQQAVLKQSYLAYRLFSGKFQNVIDEHGVEILKIKLAHFFKTYMLSLKLDNSDIWNIFNGIQYLPLDKQNFMRVQCFINNLECDFPFIESSAFLFNEHLVWSGIEPNDMQILYQYLITTLLPIEVDTELQGGSIPRHQQSPFANFSHGRFITGPTNLKNAKTIGKIPRVYFYGENAQKTYHMIVYRAMSVSVCIFIDYKMELTLDMFKELDIFMNPSLIRLASSISEYFIKHTSNTNIVSEMAPRYIYFNKLNAAFVSTVHTDNKQIGNTTISKDCIKIMADINSDKEFLGHAGETIVKTANDYWIVGKVSNMREFYVAVQQKNASLIEISEEVKKLCDNELKGIYFQSD